MIKFQNLTLLVKSGDNDPQFDDLKDSMVPLEAIERASGLVFMDRLQNQKYGKPITRINSEIVKKAGLFR